MLDKGRCIMTNNIKQERRYRRTEALILNGLTTLLQQKSIKEITRLQMSHKYGQLPLLSDMRAVHRF